MEIKGCPVATDESTNISQYLQIVEVKCDEINERVHSFLKVLGTLNICKIMSKTGCLLHSFGRYTALALSNLYALPSHAKQDNA